MRLLAIRRFFLSIFEKTSAQLNCDTVQDVTQLRQAMGKSGLHLVIGGKSLGKTKIVQTVVDNAGDEAPLLYVNMRLPSKAQSTDALECLQEEAKRRWTAKNLPFGAERLVAAGSAVLGALAKANLKEEWRWGDRRGCSGNSSLFVSQHHQARGVHQGFCCGNNGCREGSSHDCWWSQHRLSQW